MNFPFELLKKLLPGLLPVLIFILADEAWGTTAGLIAAITTGMAELVYILVKEKRLDRFIIFDTALLLAMGGISLWLENDIFFKLKPALINLIFCAVLGLSAFSRKNLLLLYSQRYLKDITFGPAQQAAMQKMVKLMFRALSAYTLLVFYSAFYMSSEAWAFISGGLFYILFGVIFAWQVISGRLKARKLRQEEWLPLVDESGKVTGKAPRSAVHANPSGEKPLHPVVHMHVINSRGDIFLQKRPMHKLVQPGKWDTAVGGHISLGESVEQALEREAAEEIGLKGFKSQAVARYRWDTDMESELSFSFVTFNEGPIIVNRREVDEGRFWTRADIERLLGKGVFTGNFEHEYAILKQHFTGMK
jgi:isopentenyldiphosphate isomerase/intracellular septation protein A